MDLGLKTLADVTTWSKYAKFIPELNRRETWDEIVDRYEVMMVKRYPQMRADILENIRYIREKKVLPSMRALQFSGQAIEVNEARIYNCSFFHIDSYYSFSEGMFLLLSGTGIGYSVQKHHVDKLPAIYKPTKTRRYLIEDSIMGWADAVKVLMKAYLAGGSLPIFDFNAIREKGARLVTGGGKAPGPEPLRIALVKIKEILDRKEDGEKLTPVECHDILCHIANSVLSGGIRRAAMISLFSLDDDQMIGSKGSAIPSKLIHQEHPTYTSKDGLVEDLTKILITVEQDGVIYKDVVLHRDSVDDEFWDLEQLKNSGTLGWWVCNEQRGRANNSAMLLRGSVNYEQFFELWKKIEESGSGEPGFYWTYDLELGTNPCCEIGLRSNQYCNLCEVNAGDIVDQDDLNNRVRVAAFFGTLQAGFTSFHYLRPIWQKVTEKEALLGVGMTGIASGAVLNLDLTAAADLATFENRRVAELIGVNFAARVTCIKPAGTTSCVLGSSSGIHGWHDEFFLRTIRFNKNEAIAQEIMNNHPGMWELDKMRPHDTICVRFPCKAPEGAILRHESAIQLLERIKKFSIEWIKPGHHSGANSHNVSATISIDKNKIFRELKGSDWTGNQVWEDKDEWQVVGEWMWENKEHYNGLSVLPYNGGTYVQAPFETITEAEYVRRAQMLGTLDVATIVEHDDNVQFGDVLACSGGNCEL